MTLSPPSVGEDRPIIPAAARDSIEVCVLAGGRSTRMAQDKTRLALGGRSLLGWVVHWPLVLGLPTRVLRHDQTPGCGPLGGIETALSGTRCEQVLFMACDMPFIGVQWLRFLISKSDARDGTFTRLGTRLGFPFILARSTLPTIRLHISRGERSLQFVARQMGAQECEPSEADAWRFSNLNTPEEFEEAQSRALACVESSVFLGTSAL